MNNDVEFNIDKSQIIKGIPINSKEDSFCDAFLTLVKNMRWMLRDMDFLNNYWSDIRAISPGNNSA